MNKYLKLFALGIAMLFLPIISYANSQLSTSSTANVQTIPAQDKLDAFLVKVAGMRQSLNDDTKYKILLTQIEQQLQTLGERYKSNTTISQMIAYLNSGITNIKREFGENKDMDDFFCALLGNCGESSPITDIENTTKGGNTSSGSSKGSRTGLVYIQSDGNGAHTNGNIPVRNTQLDSVRYPFTSIECPTGFERMGIGMRKENNGKINYQVFTCVDTSATADLTTIPKGTQLGLLYIASDANGTHTNGNTPVSNTKLDAVRYPFTGIECPTGFQRMGIGMRKENNGATNYQVFTCVKTSGTEDLTKVPSGAQLGLLYIPSNANGVHTNGNTPATSTQLDAVRYPFTGIECPTGFQRMGIGMRKENNGSTNYQVFTCVKTTEANPNSFGANEPHSSTLEAAATQTIPTNNGGYNNDYIEPEQVYIPFSDLKSDNAKLNFPDGMYISVPGGLEPAHREEYIEYYRNYYFN